MKRYLLNFTLKQGTTNPRNRPDFGGFEPLSFSVRNVGCGGRTRTFDLRVMSPTSFQLLYSAILALPECLIILSWFTRIVNPYFLSFAVETADQFKVFTPQQLGKLMVILGQPLRHDSAPAQMVGLVAV